MRRESRVASGGLTDWRMVKLMVALFVLSQLAFLYGLIVFPWRLPLSFRLFLGLIITWPTLSLYLEVPMPGGVPDLHFHRGYIMLLLLCVCVSVVVARRYGGLPSFASGERRDRMHPDSSWGRSTSAASEAVQAAPATGSAAAGSAVPLSRFVERQPEVNFRSPGLSEAYARPLTAFPLSVRAYVLAKGVAVLSSVALGVVGTTAIAAYVDSTIIPVSLYFLTKLLVDSRRRLLWLTGALLLAALIVCFTGLYECFLDLRESAFPIAPYTEAGDTRYLGVPGGRAAGVVANPPVFGGVVGLGLLLSLCCLVHSKSALTKAFCGGCAVIFAYGVFATYTRSVWISVSFALFVCQFYFKELWKWTLPVAVSGSLLLVLMWGALQQNEVVQDRLMDAKNVTGRVERLIWSGMRFIERPILGRGTGELDNLMRQEFTVDGFATSHNTYMSMLVDTGVFVFVFFVAVVFGWFARVVVVLRMQSKRQFERSMVAALAGFLAIWLLCGMSLELSYFTYYTALFWIAGALIERLADVCSMVSPPSTGETMKHAAG